MAAPTAAEAMAHITSQNRRVRTTVPPELLKSQPSWYVHNICEFPQKAELGSLRTWFIPGCPKGEKYVSVEVPGFTADEYDLGDGNGRMAWYPVMGEDLANAIVNNKGALTQLSVNSPNLEWWGCFASPNKIPKDEELTTARGKLDQMAALLLAEGDRRWNEGPSDKPGVGQNAISAMNRWAAAFKGQAREWAKPASTNVECPNCGEMVKQGIIMHVACGYIFDEKRHQANLRKSQLNERKPRKESTETEDQ